MFTRLIRLLLGPAANAGRQVLDGEARLVLPPRALADTDARTPPGGEAAARARGRSG